MAYLECKQLAQYVEGWSCFLVPVPPTDLNNTAAVAAWKVTHDDWRIKDNMAKGAIKGTLCGQYLTYTVKNLCGEIQWSAHGNSFSMCGAWKLSRKFCVQTTA